MAVVNGGAVLGEKTVIIFMGWAILKSAVWKAKSGQSVINS